MAKYLPLPDGTSFKVPSSMGYDEAMALAKERYPDAFEAEKPARKKGVLAQASKGLESLISSGRTAGASLFGDKDEAAKVGLARSRDIGSRYEEGADLEKVKKAYEERGLLSAAGEAVSQVPGAIAEQGANIAALAASGRLGATLGKPFGAKGQLIGGALGALTSGTAQALGQNVERQAAEQERAGEPVNIDMRKAVGTAIPSAALDVAGTFIPFGGRIISKLTGIPAEALLGRSAAQVAKLAEERLAVTLSKGLATGALAEIPTEIAQQMLERYQAGLSLTSPEAMKEYGETAYQVGLLAPLGGVGRLSERSGARGEVEEKAKQAEQVKRAERLQQEQTALAKQQADEEAAAQALEAEKQTPKYAVDIGKQYDALLAQFNAEKAAIKKPGANATPVEKAEYKDAQASLQALQKQLQEIVPEYRRTKPIREQEAEKARVAGMSPFDYLLEQTGEVSTAKTKAAEPDLEGYYEQQIASPQQEVTGYAANQLQLANEQQLSNEKEPTLAAKDYVDYLMVNPSMAAQVLQSRTTLPGLTKQQRNLVFSSLEQRLEELRAENAVKAARPNQARLETVEDEEQAALEASRAADQAAAEEADRKARLAPEMQALQRMKNAPSPMTENLGLFGNEEAPPSTSAAFGQLQQRLQGIPLEEGTLPTAEEVGPEGEQKRVLTRVPGAEFKLHPRAEGTGEVITAESLRDRIDRVLSTYKLSPEAAAFLRRAEQVIPEADMTLKQEASGRANQENVTGEVVADRGLLKNVSESQGFLTLLDQQLTKIESGQEGVARRGADRPELLKTFPPTKDTQAQASTTTPTEAFKYEQGATSAIPGQAASVSQAEQYAQRERLERTGKPGKLPGFVAQPEEEKRTQGVPGRATVEKRAQDINKPVYRTDPVTGKQVLVSGTIRGEGAEALALSLQRELEPLIKLAETVRDEQAGQLPLFGAADERSRVQKAERRGIEAGPSLDTGARPDVESFQRFMNSPYVRKLKQDMKKSEKDLAPVRAFLARALPRLKHLLKESKDTTARMSKIKNWTKFLKENGELASFQTNTENLVLKMNNLKLDVSELNARIKMYEQAKTQVIEEANRSGVRGRGGAAEIKILQELDDLIALHEEAKAEFTQTKAALDLVRTQIKVLVGEQRLAELKATVDPLEKSNEAAKNEIARLQDTIRTAQAELTEADNKVRQAEADKAQAVQGAKAANVQQLERQISDERTRRWNTAMSGFGKGVQIRALGAAERDARERGLTADAASEVKYKNELYNKPLLSLILELGSIDKQLSEATARVTAARKKSGSYVGGEQNVQAFKGLGSAIRLQSRLSVRKETLEDAINFMRARNTPLRTNLAQAPTVRAATPEEQDTIDQYIDQVQELGKATDRLAALTAQRDDAIKEGKTKDVARLNGEIDKVNTEISIGTEEKAKLDLALKGRVSAGARQTTSAPGKLRAGTPESKRTPGITKQPLVEQRNIKMPSVAQAVAEANALAEKRAAGEKNLTKAQLAAIEAERQAEFQVILERRDEELTNQLSSAKDRLNALNARASRPATGASNLPSLQEITDTKQEVADYEKELRAVRQEIEGVKKALYQSANEADIRAAEEAATEPVEKETKTRGRRRKVTEEEAYGETTRAEGAVGDVYFDEQDGLEFSRGTAVNGLSVAELQKEIDTALGGAGLTKGRVELFNSVEEFLDSASFADLQYAYNTKRAKAPQASDIPTDAKAFVDPRTGKAFMFANNIAKGDGLGILLHEVGVHLGFKNLFNAGQYKSLVNAVRNWSKLNDNSVEARVAKAALARVEAAQTSKEQFDDELIAYAVEEAIKAGVKPTALGSKGSPIANWLRLVIDTLKKALSAFGIDSKNLKAGELVNLAYGAAQLELRGTWHGSDATFTAFDTRYSGAGEGAFDLRFVDENSIGAGPYTTPDKKYAEYYQYAVPFGKAANATGYGSKSYQDYRSADAKYMDPSRPYVTPVADLQNIYESNLLTNYLQNVAQGGELDPQKNKGATKYLERLLTQVERNVEAQTKTLASREKRKAKPDSIESAREELQIARNQLKAAQTLDIGKIKGLAERPKTGQLYRSLDAIPRENVYRVDSVMTIGERFKLDALLKKYGIKNTYKGNDQFFANSLFYKMRRELGIKKTTEELKAAGIDVIERGNEDGEFTERAYIDQAPEILAMNLQPVGQSEGLLFSRKAQFGADDALTDLAGRVVAQPKSFSDRLGRNIALETEMNLVDMRAGLREALKAGAKEMGDTKNFVQAMYSVTKSDQKMAVVSSTLMNGPMELYTDEKGYFGIKSTGKDSAKDVFDAIGRIPGGNARGRVDLATTYMIAQRAANKGLSKLDLGDLGITEADLKAAMADVDANPELKNALEVVRSTYNSYNAGLIKFLASTGAIPKAVATKLLKDGDYVPFYRVKENGMADLVFSDEVTINIGDVRYQPYLTELKGGETRILPLTESLPRNTLLITDKALTNLAAKNVAYAFQSIGAGKGPLNKEGQPTNAMPIHKGKGVAGADIVRFNQEPDPNDPKDTGERWVRVKTDDTIMGGIPAELIVKSLEGAHLTLPAFLKIGGLAGDLLRSGVTRMPIYIARQLIRDPMAASFTGGLNYNPLTAVVKAGREFVRMNRGTSEAGQKLIEKGLVQSGIFTGDPDDIAKMALQLAGNQQGAVDQLFAGLDRAAMRADAATRALVYENAIKNGLSEVEADMATMESMNFYKRGLSPTVQYASRLIPFFNAQIQGLNVLYKAATGKMPFEEQQNIKQKFFNNAMLLVATGVVYAMAMEDDEAYKRAKPKDKYSNFFIPVPGVEEPFKLPIPYEAGWFFSLAVAAVDGMKAETDGKQQFDALRDMFLMSIPGYSSKFMPQIIKPAFEVYSNKNFYTGNDIESSRMQDKTTAERFNISTTEAAKAMSKALPMLSPVQIEHISNGYFGQLPLIIAAAANGLFRQEGRGEAPEKRITDQPFIGSSFQKKYGGADADVMYRMAKESMQAKASYDSMLKQGRVEDAREFLADNRTEIVAASLANQYRTQMGRLRSDEERITGMAGLSGEEKRKRIDRINEARQAISEKFEAALKRIEASGRT
jgi:hypothetical protein